MLRLIAAALCIWRYGLAPAWALLAAYADEYVFRLDGRC
jgi:hypothetical protein